MCCRWTHDSKIDTEDLDTIKMVFLAAQQMGLKCIAGDITLEYIQAHTKEKVYTIAGPEFGDLEGRVLLLAKALYGLQESGNA